MADDPPAVDPSPESGDVPVLDAEPSGSPLATTAAEVVAENGGRSRGVWCKVSLGGHLVCLVDPRWVGGKGEAIGWAGWPPCGWVWAKVAIGYVSAYYGIAVPGWVRPGTPVEKLCLWSQIETFGLADGMDQDPKSLATFSMLKGAVRRAFGGFSTRNKPIFKGGKSGRKPKGKKKTAKVSLRAAKAE